MAKRARNIFKRVRKYFFLSLGERINLPADWQAGVRAGQKATIGKSIPSDLLTSTTSPTFPDFN